MRGLVSEVCGEEVSSLGLASAQPGLVGANSDAAASRWRPVSMTNGRSAAWSAARARFVFITNRSNSARIAGEAVSACMAGRDVDARSGEGAASVSTAKESSIVVIAEEAVSVNMVDERPTARSVAGGACKLIFAMAHVNYISSNAMQLTGV